MVDLKTIRVGILQEEYGTDPIENYEKTHRILSEKYYEADVVILPEYSMINILGGLSPQEVFARSEEINNSRYLEKLSRLAGELGTSILAHFIEKTDKPPRSMSTSVAVFPDGRIEKAYSKIHLFDAYGYRESDYLLPGKELSRPIRIGDFIFYVAICYDLRFPELFRTYALMGAHGVFLHAGWVRGPLKEEILDVLARSRSHENTMFLVLSNHVGRQYTGRSGVYNPYGVKIIDLGAKPDYMEVELDINDVYEARRNIPVLEHSKQRWKITFNPSEESTG